MAEAWTRNEATLDDVEKAANDVRKYTAAALDDVEKAANNVRKYTAAAKYSAKYAAEASTYATYAAYAANVADAYAYAAHTAVNAAYASGDYNTAIRELATIVREFIPIEKILTETAL